MAEDTEKMPRKLWKVLFAISLALNVAVVGLVVGIGFRFAGGKPPQAFEFGLGPIGLALSQNQRREIGRSLRENPDVLGLGRFKGDGMVREVLAVLRAETLDTDALQQALATSRQRAQVLQTAARDAFVEQVAAMSDDERAAFADRLESAMTHRRNR